MLRTPMLALAFALAVMPAVTAAPLPIPSVAAITQGSADPNQAIFADYVQRAIDTLPGQMLPDYAPGDFSLFNALMRHLDTVSGLVPDDDWCTVGIECFIPCEGSTPVPEIVIRQLTHGCGNTIPPPGVHDAVLLQAESHQSAGTVALYVVFFYRPTATPGPYAFPISLPGPYSGGDPFCDAAPNSVGSGARISSLGTPCIRANDLVLSAGPVPDQLGVFFWGTTLVTQQPFGNGFRCTGGSLVRLSLEQASGGVLAHAVDFTDPASPASALTAGSTRYVQAWYRDPASGGAGFNLSDGLTLQLYP